jgi:hypothetical protein
LLIWREKREEKRREEKSEEKIGVFHCLVGDKRGGRIGTETYGGPESFLFELTNCFLSKFERKLKRKKLGRGGQRKQKTSLPST